MKSVTAHLPMRATSEKPMQIEPFAKSIPWRPVNDSNMTPSGGSGDLCLRTSAEELLTQNLWLWLSTALLLAGDSPVDAGLSTQVQGSVARQSDGGSAAARGGRGVAGAARCGPRQSGAVRRGRRRERAAGGGEPSGAMPDSPPLSEK